MHAGWNEWYLGFPDRARDLVQSALDDAERSGQTFGLAGGFVSASRLWGRHRYPTTFLVGADGVVRFINRGYGPGYGARIEARLRALLPPR